MNKESPARADLQPTIADLKAMPLGHVIQGASIALDGATKFSAEDLENELSMALNPQLAK